MIDISDINITRDVYSLWRMMLLTKFTAQLATRPWDSGPQRKRSFVYRWPSRVTNTLQTCLSRFAADDTYSQCNELLNSILFTPNRRLHLRTRDPFVLVHHVDTTRPSQVVDNNERSTSFTAIADIDNYDNWYRRLSFYVFFL